MKDEHVKDAARDVAGDVALDVAELELILSQMAQKPMLRGEVGARALRVRSDVAEGALGAAEDGGVKFLIADRVIFQRRNPRPTHACRPPRCPWATLDERAREGRGAGRCRHATGPGAGHGLRGPGAARSLRHATTAAVFVQLALR